jgi:hypothetical protein
MSFTKEQLETLMSNTIANLKEHSNFIEATVDGMQKDIVTHETFWGIFKNLMEESDTLGYAFADDVVGIGLVILYKYCKCLAKTDSTKKADPAPEATKDEDPVLQKFSTLMDKLEDDHK